MFYIDFNCLYAFVQHKYAFLINHPEVITNEKYCFQKLTTLTEATSSDKDRMGFAKCTVLPPKQIFIPTLPVKINGKLLFLFANNMRKKNKPKIANTTSNRD